MRTPRAGRASGSRRRDPKRFSPFPRTGSFLEPVSRSARRRGRFTILGDFLGSYIKCNIRRREIRTWPGGCTNYSNLYPFSWTTRGVWTTAHGRCSAMSIRELIFPWSNFGLMRESRPRSTSMCAEASAATRRRHSDCRKRQSRSQSARLCMGQTRARSLRLGHSF
jgi:hypothetical protein